MNDCYHPFTGACIQGPGCPVREKSSCPPCNHACNQGRSCPARASKLAQQNSDGSDPSLPIAMFDKPLAWLRDLFFTAVYVGGSVCLGVLLLLALVFATGLHRVIF
jgi:hypothetical protein